MICCSDSGPVKTKIIVPVDYDIVRRFTCGSCSSGKINEEKSYAETLKCYWKLTNENDARATLFNEVQNEQRLLDKKKTNLVVKGTKPYGWKTDRDLVNSIAEALDIEKPSNQAIEIKIIEQTGRQLLLLKFKSS